MGAWMTVHGQPMAYSGSWCDTIISNLKGVDARPGDDTWWRGPNRKPDTSLLQYSTKAEEAINRPTLDITEALANYWTASLG